MCIRDSYPPGGDAKGAGGKRGAGMSIRSLTMLAVARDKTAPSAPARGGGGEAAAAPDGTVAGPPARRPAGQPAAQVGVPQQFADVPTSAIPTEPLTAT